MDITARRRRRALSGTVTAALVAVSLAGAPASARSTGTLDPSFGDHGVTRVDLGGPSIDVAHGAMLNPGGAGTVLVGSANDRFALAGPSASAPFSQVIVGFPRPSAAYAAAAANDLVAVGHAGDDFAVARLTRFGNPVVAFGDQGRVTTSFGRAAVARGVTLQLDDAYVVGTVGSGADADVALARYDSLGHLDPTFGSGGTIVADLSGAADAAHAVRSEPLNGVGNLLVAGRAGGAAFVGRYRTDGTWDPTFGSGGRILLDLTPGDDIAYGLTPRIEGGMVVTGISGSGGFVARLTSAGALDTTFGTGGLVFVDLGPGGGFRSVAIAQSSPNPAQTVLLGGTTVSPSGTDGVIVRLTEAGQYDAGFGTSGRVIVDFGGTADRGTAVFAQGTRPQGAILVGDDGRDMRVEAFGPDGQPGPPPEPTSFRIDFSASSEWGEEMAVQPDGAIVVVGGGDPGLVVARFRPDGRLDPTFGEGGVVVEPLGDGSAVALQPDGKILVGGRRGPRAWGVYRFLPDGRIDPAFGHFGFTGIDVSGMATVGGVVVRPDGRIVVGTTELLVLSPSGQVETSTSMSATGFEVASGLAMEPDGAVVAVLRNRNDISGSGGRAVRLLLDGTLDPTFVGPVRGAAGGVVRLADGRFVLVGDLVTGRTPGGLPSGTDVVLTALTPDGRADDSFGGPEADGIVTVDIGRFDHAPDLTVAPDGKILVSFSHRTDSTSRLGVARFLPDGRLDRTFASKGTWVDAFASWPSAVTSGTGGRILVAGRSDGPNHDMALLGVTPGAVAGGRPTAWGFGALGQLGVGAGRAVAVAAGTHHTLTVAGDGTVWASGWNLTGQLGNGTKVDSPVPVRVTGLTDVVAVAAGTYHSLALKADGSVWAWGWNHFGQLGTGTTKDSPVPVRVAGLTQVTSIAAGAHHNLALRADGTAWAWGWNGVGQLGTNSHLTNSTADALTAVPVRTPGEVTEVAAGSYHSLFLYGSGTIMSAGWNAFGQLGRGSANGLAPSAVEDSGTSRGRYVAIAGGGLHSLAITADGTLSAWGYNRLGALGDGTTIDRPAPVPVPGVTNALAIAGGAYHSLVLGRNGVVQAWGWNGYGQLGTGAEAGAGAGPPAVVAAVPAGTVVTGIAGGALHSVAY